MAIGATAVWEVRDSGLATNGGFYTSGGTDYSQQDAAKITKTDGACSDHVTFAFTSATAVVSA